MFSPSLWPKCSVRDRRNTCPISRSLFRWPQSPSGFRLGTSCHKTMHLARAFTGHSLQTVKTREACEKNQNISHPYLRQGVVLPADPGARRRLGSCDSPSWASVGSHYMSLKARYVEKHCDRETFRDGTRVRLLSVSSAENAQFSKARPTDEIMSLPRHGIKHQSAPLNTNSRCSCELRADLACCSGCRYFS